MIIILYSFDILKILIEDPEQVIASSKSYELCIRGCVDY